MIKLETITKEFENFKEKKETEI